MKVPFPVTDPMTDLEKKAFEIGVCQISFVRLAKKMNNSSKYNNQIFDNSMIENLRKTDAMNKEMLFRIMKICEREGIPERTRRQFLESAKNLSHEQQDSMARDSIYCSEIELEILAVMEVMDS